MQSQLPLHAHKTVQRQFSRIIWGSQQYPQVQENLSRLLPGYFYKPYVSVKIHSNRCNITVLQTRAVGTMLTRKCGKHNIQPSQNCSAISLRYSASKNGETLKTGFGVVTRSLKMALLDTPCTTFYVAIVSILHHFQVI